MQPPIHADQIDPAKLELRTDLDLNGADQDAFEQADYNAARPFANFLPGIAGEYGKPMWVFTTNRGQCVASFGVRDRNAAMLAFYPADQAYAQTPLFGFRSFFRLLDCGRPVIYEPFHTCPEKAVRQKLIVRPAEIEIQEEHAELGLRMRVVYYTLPDETLPVLARHVTVENFGRGPIAATLLDGLPRVLPYGLDEGLHKQMSRTMEAFAEIRHVAERLPFYKLKVVPSDKPDIEWIEAGFFTFTLQDGVALPVIADPDLVFGAETSLRQPLAFLDEPNVDPCSGRQETLTGCAFTRLGLSLRAGGSSTWTSYFGHAPNWQAAHDFRQRAAVVARYAEHKRIENSALIARLGSHFDLLAEPARLAAYTRQSFLDNSLRGGLPLVIEGPRGVRVFHVFTRKHGDLERDYNFFSLSPTCMSQGNSNFRDVNQNRRSENFLFHKVGSANIETFFNLLQIDGNNPLVVLPERFCVPAQSLPALLQHWPDEHQESWRGLLGQPFSPGQLLQELIATEPSQEAARALFERIIGLADMVQEAAHGEGYWVDHWIYCLDLLDSYAALYPDRLGELLIQPGAFGIFDNDHVVQPRDRKYVLRADGTVRQLRAVVQDPDKTRMLARRREAPHALRSQHGMGAIYRTTLLARLLNLFAIKTSQLDPFGVGLEMEADKPGWCDALNGLPGLFASSTHEAHALRRGLAFVHRAMKAHAITEVSLAREVATLLESLSTILAEASSGDFFSTWQQLATRREAFRIETRFGVDGAETLLSQKAVLDFVTAADQVLARGLASALDAQGLPISYFIHEVTDFAVLPAPPPTDPADDGVRPVYVRVTGFSRKPLSAFLEGAVHALRACSTPAQAASLQQAVRRSSLYDDKLGMYRVNAPLDQESYEIGRSRIFAPGWLENESIFLHMHYKYLLETLRGGLAETFFADLRRGLVCFQAAEIYGRSPLENVSFIASSRFADAKMHGNGFVARLSGATAEWISMLLHMTLGAAPFRMVDGALRFEPKPTLADWLFTLAPQGGFRANSFGLKLFGNTWLVYENPSRQPTFGASGALPSRFELHYADGGVLSHQGAWLPAQPALDLRDGRLSRLVIGLA